MKTLVIIGGGASGVFCAANAARMFPALQVIILEKSSRLLSKVRVSGGGRCNVTHSVSTIAEMVKAYPRGGNFLRKSFSRFFVADTIDWFTRRGVALKTEADGRMFPETDSSETIIECLVAELNRYRVEVRFQADVRRIEKLPTNFALTLADGRILDANYVCVATGGFPRASMFDWLTALGHKVVEPVPSLFTFNLKQNNITRLMGLSVPEASPRIAGTSLKETGPVLVTHWGLSGPAILRLSAWGARELQERNYTFTALVNWVNPLTEAQVRDIMIKTRFAGAARKMANECPFNIPSRLWLELLEQSGVKADLRWADLPAAGQNKLIKNLFSYEASVSGKTTFKEEFVTAGGIELSEINPQTMESRIQPGLFFAGEIMDVDGITGGYNFQHAWTSGWIVAKSLSEHSSQ